jgi:ABC-type sugar transport system ATPase subunit
MTLGLKDLNKSFGRKRLLVSASAAIPTGITCLVGPSGSGKSTLFRMISGLDNDFSGAILFGDRNVNSLRPQERGLSYLFQLPPMPQQATVEAAISLPLIMSGTPAPSRKRLVTEICHRLRIDPLLDRPIANLSGGEKQRAALARTLVRSTSIVLLDEPFKSSIEPELRGALRGLIVELQAERQQTMVIITHDPDDVVGLSDHIAAIGQDGSIVIQSTQEAVQFPRTLTIADSTGLFVSLTATLGGNEYALQDLPFIPVHATEAASPLTAAGGLRLRANALTARAGEDLRVVREISSFRGTSIVHVVPTAGHSSDDGRTHVLTVTHDRELPQMINLGCDSGQVLCFDARGQRTEPCGI